MGNFDDNSMKQPLDAVSQTEARLRCYHKTTLRSKLTPSIQLFSTITKSRWSSPFPSSTLRIIIFLGRPSTTANPNGVTINNSIVNVIVVAPGTASACKKESKKERAEAKLASNLLSQAVIYGYAMRSNVNMKSKNGTPFWKTTMYAPVFTMIHDTNHLDSYY